MKFNLINYLKHSRYRPLNLIESLFAQVLNFIYIRRSKNFSFHVLRYKDSPTSTKYYNKIGRFLILLVNFVSISIFNKFLIKDLGLSDEVYKNHYVGENKFHWPLSTMMDFTKQKLINEEEIKKKINLQYEYSLKRKDKTDLPFWTKNRAIFKENFFDENNNIILKNLQNFRNSKIKFSSNLLKNNNIDNFETRSNKLKALKIFNIYHKVAELVDDDIILNLSDNNIGNTKFIHYRKQLVNERILRQAYFLSQIRKYTDLNQNKLNIFCDIGPGYGLLCSLLKKNYINSKFLLVDLPELNILAYYFLQSLFPKSKICLSHEIQDHKVINQELIDKYDFIILEQNDLEKIEENLSDCVINTASLGEMSDIDQSFYIKQIERISKKYFYSVNRFRSDNIHFSKTTGYYDFKLSGNKWSKKLYKFSPTFHLEVLLKKNDL